MTPILATATVPGSVDTVSRDWIYQRLVCEFKHWDCCLVGLVLVGGERKLCRVAGNIEEKDEDGEVDLVPIYSLHEIAWDAECDEYLNDYRLAYHHWFHENGARPRYDGRPLGWFSDKWSRNPIVEKSK